MAAYEWVDSSADRMLPQGAFRGGVDVGGGEMYVGKGFHEGDWIPAKVICRDNRYVALVAYGGGEYSKDTYQVLCELEYGRLLWAPTRDREIPQEALEGGRTSGGEKLHIGRVYHSGSLTVGKVHPSHGQCYIPFNKKEVSYRQYEILIVGCGVAKSIITEKRNKVITEERKKCDIPVMDAVTSHSTEKKVPTEI